MNNRILQEYQKTKEEVRLNKYLSEAGICSRREADRLIGLILLILIHIAPGSNRAD